jgi:hypothetical protein
MEAKPIVFEKPREVSVGMVIALLEFLLVILMTSKGNATDT